MRRSPRLRVASNLNGGYEKRVCRPERATVPREISDESHTEVAEEREESRFDPMKNAGYIGKLVETSVRWKDSAWPPVLLALISLVINLCVGRDIYATCTQRSNTNPRGLRPEKSKPLFRILRCPVLSRFHLCTSDVFATRDCTLTVSLIESDRGSIKLSLIPLRVIVTKM